MQGKSSKMLQLNKAIGYKIKQLRIQKNISLTQLAYSFEISKGTLSNLEAGEGFCKVATLWKVVNALGMKFSEFVLLLEQELGEDFTLIDE